MCALTVLGRGSDACDSSSRCHGQMVDRMDQGLLPAQVVPNTYDALWRLVSKALYRTHVEGKLKARAAATCSSALCPSPSIHSFMLPAFRLSVCEGNPCTDWRRLFRASGEGLCCGDTHAVGLAPSLPRICPQAEIIQDPAAYAELDPDMARTLLDQKQAVRALLLFRGRASDCSHFDTQVRSSATFGSRFEDFAADHLDTHIRLCATF